MLDRITHRLVVRRRGELDKEMDIYKKLSNVKDDGLLMLVVLKHAAAEGCTQNEAIEALQRLFEEASEQGDDEDIIIDVLDIAKNYCRPEFRIWGD